MADLSLSNALLDGVISGVHRYEDDTSYGTPPEGTPSFPALIYTDPHKALDQRILFKPPTKKEEPPSDKRRRHSEITPPSFTAHTKREDDQPKTRRFSAAVFSSGAASHDQTGHNKKAWDIGQLFSKRKKQVKKGGTLTRSLSWDAIHRLHRLQEEEEEKEAPPQTFVYKPQKITRRLNRRYSPKDSSQELTSSSTSNETHPKEESYEKEKEGEETIDTNEHIEGVPLVPYRNDEMPTSVYEVPRPTPVKPPRTKKVVLIPVSPPVSPPPIKPRTKKTKVKRETFTIQDIIPPQPSLAPTSSQEVPLSKPEDIGLLKIKVLAVRLPQAPVKTRSEATGYDTDEEERPPITKVTPTDGLFCVLSINGKQSHYESSLQPLNTIKQASVWDQIDESEAIFYATHSQQVFVRSYKLPLADKDMIDSKNGDQSLSGRAKAECVGVGILPISSLPPVLVKGDRGSVEDWTKVESEGMEVTVPLEPHGSVLLKASYTCNVALSA